MLMTFNDGLALVLGGLFALVVGLSARRIGELLGLMDAPDPVGGRKRHDFITPLVGGFGCVLPALVVLVITAVRTDFPNDLSRQEMSWILGATIVLFFVGVLDDKFSLSPKLRLVVSILVFCVLILQVPDLHLELLWFSFTKMPIFVGAIGSVLSILCLVGLLNALNMMDGKNGLVIGVALFWVFALWIHAPMQLKPLLCTLFAGLLVMLYFNLRGMLFMGDSGVYGLSALVGMLAIFVYNRRPDTLMADQIILWLSFPVVDCLRVMSARILKGRSPFDPGRDHFHHYLAKYFGWNKGKYICWALVWVPGILSILYPALTPMLLLAMLGGYTLVLLLVARPPATTLSSAG
jgi:UDP-GlcNAc:undecaprenyl-phosphate/decaprenyl-phosphate GlcNAc-1-phosphate transferase